MSPTEGWPRVQVHPGAGVVTRRGDALLVVPVVPPGAADGARDLLAVCAGPDPTGDARTFALRGLLDLHTPAELPGFALLQRSGGALRVLVHGPVRVLVDGRPTGRPAGRLLAEQVVEDGAWHLLTIAADGEPPAVALADTLDLEAGAVPGGGVTLHPAAGLPEPTTRSGTALRPAVRFRNVPLGECAASLPGRRRAPQRRPPLPVAGSGAPALGGTPGGTEVVVEGVRCPQGHFTDPDRAACLTCAASLPPGAERVRLPRPPLGILVTDGGTIYPVTGDLVIGREPEQAPDVVAGRARPLPLHDAARSTSRVHARLTVRGWQVLLGDDASANGTFVSGHGAGGPWLPATADTPLLLAHGDRIRLGRRQLLFDAWRETVIPQAFR